MLGNKFVFSDVNDQLEFIEMFHDIFGCDGGEDFGSRWGHGLLHDDDGLVDTLFVHSLQIPNAHRELVQKAPQKTCIPSNGLHTNSRIFGEKDVQLIGRVALALDDEIQPGPVNDRAADTKSLGELGKAHVKFRLADHVATVVDHVVGGFVDSPETDGFSFV